MEADHDVDEGGALAMEQALARKAAAVRARLMHEYRIDSDFIGVPKLARVLGLAPSTIYGYMRRGEFFMPFRMINTTAMVSMDDLAEWHCGGGAQPAPKPAEAPPAPEPMSMEERARAIARAAVQSIERARIKKGGH